MSKKIIAVDLDDVLTINVPAFIEFSNERWGTNLTIDDFIEDWRTMWGVDTETLKARIEEWDKSKMMSEYKHFTEAKNVLLKLKNNYKLVITTSRRKKLTQITAEWIDKYFQDVFENVHHAGIFDGQKEGAHLETKADICTKVGADYLIDDHPKHCFAAARAGITALLFGEYPWSREDNLPKRVVRVRNWQEVAEYFDV